MFIDRNRNSSLDGRLCTVPILSMKNQELVRIEVDIVLSVVSHESCSQSREPITINYFVRAKLKIVTGRKEKHLAKCCCQLVWLISLPNFNEILKNYLMAQFLK